MIYSSLFVIMIGSSLNPSFAQYQFDFDPVVVVFGIRLLSSFVLYSPITQLCTHVTQFCFVFVLYSPVTKFCSHDIMEKKRLL